MPAASQSGRNGKKKNRGDAWLPWRIFEALDFVVSAQNIIASLRQKQYWREDLHVGAYKGPVSRANVRRLTRARSTWDDHPDSVYQIHEGPR